MILDGMEMTLKLSHKQTLICASDTAAEYKY